MRHSVARRVITQAGSSRRAASNAEPGFSCRLQANAGRHRGDLHLCSGAVTQNLAVLGCACTCSLSDDHAVLLNATVDRRPMAVVVTAVAPIPPVIVAVITISLIGPVIDARRIVPATSVATIVNASTQDTNGNQANCCTKKLHDLSPMTHLNVCSRARFQPA